jgi:bacillithiol biosynthesis cysteine-adding enzyme BshC
MEAHCIPIAATKRFPALVVDHLEDAEGTRDLHAGRPDLEGLSTAARARSFDGTHRAVLVKALHRQYAGLGPGAAVAANLERLARPDALTVTTGHQLGLFGGPLYVPFKLLNTIRTARELEATLGRPVVPIFWMATEDHDRAEIDHTWFGDHRLHWPGAAAGAVGRLHLEGIGPVVEEAVAHLGAGVHAADMAALLRACYRPEYTLAEATRRFVHALFGRFGLVILDGDDPDLKRLFVPVLRRELTEQVAHAAVSRTNAQLADRYGAQAHVREINLFHLRPGHRSRIVAEGASFRALDGGPTWTREALLAEVEGHPEHFSPNVLLRPVYQETILPNVAYIGGAGELAYWLQLRGLFDDLKVPMPRLVLRNSAAFMGEKTLRRWHDLGLSLEDLFEPQGPLQARVAAARASFRTELSEERSRLSAFYNELLATATAADPTLRGSVEARRASAFHGLDRLERSLLRAARQREDVAVRHMQTAQDALFPGGVLQERRQNILPMLAASGTEQLEFLLDRLDPFTPGLTLFVEP